MMPPEADNTKETHETLGVPLIKKYATGAPNPDWTQAHPDSEFDGC